MRPTSGSAATIVAIGWFSPPVAIVSTLLCVVENVIWTNWSSEHSVQEVLLLDDEEVVRQSQQVEVTSLDTICGSLMPRPARVA